MPYAMIYPHALSTGLDGQGLVLRVFENAEIVDNGGSPALFPVRRRPPATGREAIPVSRRL